MRAYLSARGAAEPATPRVVTQDMDVQATAQSRHQRIEARPDTHDVALNATVATTDDTMLTDVSDTTGRQTDDVQTALSTLSMTSTRVQHGAPYTAFEQVETQSTTPPTSQNEADATYDLTDFAEENDRKTLCDLFKHHFEKLHMTYQMY